MTQKPTQRESFDVTDDASVAQEANTVESGFDCTIARSRVTGVLVLTANGRVISTVAIASYGVSDIATVSLADTQETATCLSDYHSFDRFT